MFKQLLSIVLIAFSFIITPSSSSLQDSWILEFEDIINAQESNVFEGLQLQHRVSKNKTNEQLRVSLYRDNCADPYDGGAVILMDKGIEQDESSELDKAVFSLQFDQLLMSSSPLWQESANSDKGIMSFCVKTELLYLENEAYLSVSFTETILRLTVNFSSANFFEIQNINLIERVMNNIEESTKFSVSTCVCQKLQNKHECITDPVIYQNSMFSICVSPKSSGLIISNFDNLIFYQDGEAKYTPIVNGNQDSLTSFQSGSVGVVETRITSNFFNNMNPPPVTINGVASLSFLGDISNNERRRGLKEENQNTNFELNIQLQPSSNFFSMPLLIGVNFIVVSAFVLLTRSNSQRKRDTNKPFSRRKL